MDLEVKDTLDDFEDELLCKYCFKLFLKPVQLPCGHLICEDCLREYMIPHVASGVKSEEKNPINSFSYSENPQTNEELEDDGDDSQNYVEENEADFVVPKNQVSTRRSTRGSKIFGKKGKISFGLVDKNLNLKIDAKPKKKKKIKCPLKNCKELFPLDLKRLQEDSKENEKSQLASFNHIEMKISKMVTKFQNLKEQIFRMKAIRKKENQEIPKIFSKQLQNSSVLRKRKIKEISDSKENSNEDNMKLSDKEVMKNLETMTIEELLKYRNELEIYKRTTKFGEKIVKDFQNNVQRKGINLMHEDGDLENSRICEILKTYDLKIDNYVPNKKRKLEEKKFVISYSRLSEREVQRLNFAAKTYLNGSISPSFSEKVTHIVFSGERARRTSKYFQGILNGCWIVSMDWINDILKLKKYVPEEFYEIAIDNNSEISLPESFHNPIGTPKRGRLRKENNEKNLFEDLFFYIVKINKNRGFLSILLENGKGQIVKQLPDIYFSRDLKTVCKRKTKRKKKNLNPFGITKSNAVVVVGDNIDENIRIKMIKEGGYNVVKFQTIVDCVSAYENEKLLTKDEEPQLVFTPTKK